MGVLERGMIYFNPGDLVCVYGIDGPVMKVRKAVISKREVGYGDDVKIKKLLDGIICYWFNGLDYVEQMFNSKDLVHTETKA